MINLCVWIQCSDFCPVVSGAWFLWFWYELCSRHEHSVRMSIKMPPLVATLFFFFCHNFIFLNLFSLSDVVRCANNTVIFFYAGWVCSGYFIVNCFAVSAKAFFCEHREWKFFNPRPMKSNMTNVIYRFLLCFGADPICWNNRTWERGYQKRCLFVRVF